jgi:uncharacterized membrane-anchored protein
MNAFLPSVLAKWRAITLSQRAIGLAVLSTIFLLGMVGNEHVRRTTGAEIILRTRPVDPRDLIRGAYVQLEYEVERVHLPDLPTAADPSGWRANDVLFLALRQDESGQWRPYSLTRNKPAGGLAVRASYVRREDYADVTEPGKNIPVDILIDIGADRYFSDSEGAKALEKRAREQGALDVVLSVGKDGKAVIKGLIIDGEKRYEKLF